MLCYLFINVSDKEKQALTNEIYANSSTKLVASEKNKKDETAIHSASANGHLDVMKIIVQSGLSPTEVNDRGKS